MTQINIPFDPSNFTGGPITNQFMPLAVGNTWFYTVSDGSTDTVTVTDKTINIDGVKCVVVSDIVKEGSKTTGQLTTTLPRIRPATSGISARTPRRSNPAERAPRALGE